MRHKINIGQQLKKTILITYIAHSQSRMRHNACGITEVFTNLQSYWICMRQGKYP